MRSGDMRRRRWWDARSIVGTSTRASVGCALPLQDVRSAPQPSARLVDDRVGERAALGERRRSPGVLPTEMFGDLARGHQLVRIDRIKCALRHRDRVWRTTRAGVECRMSSQEVGRASVTSRYRRHGKTSCQTSANSAAPFSDLVYKETFIMIVQHVCPATSTAAVREGLALSALTRYRDPCENRRSAQFPLSNVGGPR